MPIPSQYQGGALDTSYQGVIGLHLDHVNAINSINQNDDNCVCQGMASHFIDLNAVFGSFHQYFICCIAYKMLSTKPIISQHEDRLANKQLAVQ